jgi:hypothetical protein
MSENGHNSEQYSEHEHFELAVCPLMFVDVCGSEE